MSFKAEIEAIVGDIDSPDYTSEAELYLAEGVKFITKSLVGVPDIGNRLTSTSTLNNSSTTLDTSDILRIISVVRNDGTRNRPAKQVPYDKIDDYSDVNSIYYTSKLDPVYSIIDDTLHVVPTPTASETATVRKVSPDTSVALTDTSLTGMPDELERGVILYASKELLRYIMNQIRKPNVSNATNLTDDMVAGNIDTAGDRLEFDKYFDMAMDYIADEDVELAQTMMGQIQAYLQNYQTDLTADTQQYQWYESQYIKVTQDLLTFLSQYIAFPTQGVDNEIAADA